MSTVKTSHQPSTCWVLGPGAGTFHPSPPLTARTLNQSTGLQFLPSTVPPSHPHVTFFHHTHFSHSILNLPKTCRGIAIAFWLCVYFLAWQSQISTTCCNVPLHPPLACVPTAVHLALHNAHFNFYPHTLAHTVTCPHHPSPLLSSPSPWTPNSKSLSILFCAWRLGKTFS